MSEHEASSGTPVVTTCKKAAKRRRLDFVAQSRSHKRRWLDSVAQSQQPPLDRSQLRDRAMEMRYMTPEDIVDLRHNEKPLPIVMHKRTRNEEEYEKMDLYVAKFFYECGVPLNAITARSFEVMVEAIGRFGPGYEPPSLDYLRKPLLDKAMKEMRGSREEHEMGWLCGCTLLVDSWTDRRNRHLINFLVNGCSGTFFLESVDASDYSHDAVMLADLIEKRIKVVGRDWPESVVQVVTNGGSNIKAACRVLMGRIPTLFWTPCASRCLDLMLEDIANLGEFKKHIKLAKRVTTFIYRHGRLLKAMKGKLGGKDLVRPAATRFSTAFLTLKRLYKHRDAIRSLFGCEDWTRSKLSSTEAGKTVCDTVLSTGFWDVLEDCVSSSQPLLVLLRRVNKKRAMPAVYAGMELAKKKIHDSFASKPVILNKVLDIIERRWAEQKEQKLYEAALFLNPSKFYDIKRDDPAYACRLRAIFNDVLVKMLVADANLVTSISDLADQYENMQNRFGHEAAITGQKTMDPGTWWFKLDGTCELWRFASRIVGLCCSVSIYECDRSTFESIHMKKKNPLEYKRLKDLIYVQYNWKLARRFAKERELGSKFNPLIREEFQWDNEWVDIGAEEVHGKNDLSWAHADVASKRTDGVVTGYDGLETSAARLTDELDSGNGEDEPFVVDDEDIEDDYGPAPPLTYDDIFDEYDDYHFYPFRDDFPSDEDSAWSDDA